MNPPDWEFAGKVVGRAIDEMGLRNDEEVAKAFGLDTDTIGKVVNNGYTRGPQRETRNLIDKTLMRVRNDWYMGRTRAIAYGNDREFTLHALTSEEYRVLLEARNPK